MELTDKNILIISPEDWGPCWVSKHHYAANLAKRGNQVFFLNRSLKEPKCTDDLPNGLTVLAGQKLPKGIRFLPAPLRRYAHKRALTKLGKLAGVNFDLIWSFDASRYLDLDSDVTGCPSIFYMADFADRIPWRIPVASATLCLGVSHGIVDEMKTVSDRVQFIQHGYSNFPPEPYSFSTSSPNAVYAGSLAHGCIDRPRMLSLVDAYPEVNFHFFGDDGTGNLGGGNRSEHADQLNKRRNCYLHGAVPSSKLPGIYREADVLYICHNPEFDRIGNPHKMMEYLASGTPVISAPLREYQELSDVVAFEDKSDAFTRRFRTLLDGEFTDGAEKRREYALNNSYANQIERVEKWLAGSLWI